MHKHETQETYFSTLCVDLCTRVHEFWSNFHCDLLNNPLLPPPLQLVGMDPDLKHCSHQANTKSTYLIKGCLIIQCSIHSKWKQTPRRNFAFASVRCERTLTVKLSCRRDESPTDHTTGACALMSPTLVWFSPRNTVASSPGEGQLRLVDGSGGFRFLHPPEMFFSNVSGGRLLDCSHNSGNDGNDGT